MTYLSLEASIDAIVRALEAGYTDGSLGPVSNLDMLLLDDVELLAGRKAAEELFIRILGELNRKGGQIVLGSSQAPSEIRDLDHRLVERFSGGLIVDIATPEFDTRVDIARRKVEDRGGELAKGVAELLGRVSVTSIRELSGIINRLMTIQELEGRLVQTQEIPALLENLDLRSGDEFGAFVDELAGDVATTVEVADAPWRRILREALDAGEAEGYNCGRLRHLLDQRTPPPDTRRIVERFTHDVDRLRGIRQELHRLGDPWPEAALGVLRDPERMEEAEALLTSAYELTRAYPPLPTAPGIDDLPNLPEAGDQARRLLAGAESDPRQIYFWSAEGKGAQMLLASIGTDFRTANPEGKIAFISVRDFTEDFIRALTAGVAGAWRERWWKVDLLLVHRLQDLSGTERARDELFHLFEAVHRSGGRIALAADRPPSRIAGIDDRVRKRLEKGLVIEVESDDVPRLGTPAAEPVFDPVLGANVLDEDALADFPDIGGGLAASTSERQKDIRVENPPTDGLLTIDPGAFDALDSLLAGGASSATSASGSFRQGSSKDTGDEPDPTRGSPSATDAAGSDDEDGTEDRIVAAGFDWSPSREEVVWCWHKMDDLIVQEWTGRSKGGGARHGA